MANIRVDLGYTIKDGAEIKFRSPVDCSQITGLIVYFLGDDGNTASQEFVLADAHGNNVGDIDHLFAENVVVKVILDVTTGMAFVQNADTNEYIECNFVKKDPEESISDLASAVGTGCFAGAKAYQIIDKGPSSGIGGADGYYVLWTSTLPEENITGFDYSIRTDAAYELCGKIVAIGPPESGLDGIDDEGNHQYGCMTGLKVYVSGYQSSPLIDNTSGSWSEMANTFRIPELPSVGNKDYGMAAWSEGWKTKAIGTAANAEGWKTKAVGIAAHVEGGYNEAIGEMSHVEGMNNLALGKGSHVEGIYNIAYKDLSHVSGVANRASWPYQTVVGTYNSNKEDTLFEVGVGDVATAKRATGFEVKKDGSARVLTESTEPDAVVRYSQVQKLDSEIASKHNQLEKAIAETTLVVGYDEPEADCYEWYDLSNGGENAPDMVPLVEMDFEDGNLNELPRGWTASPATPPNSSAPAQYYFASLKGAPDSNTKVFGFSNYGYGDLLLDYKLSKSLTVTTLEYKVNLVKTSTVYAAVLPTLFYEGQADGKSTTNQPTPLMLFVQQVGNDPVLTFSYGRPAYDVATTLSWKTWHSIRIEYDAETHKTNLYVDGQQISLNAINEQNYDPYAGMPMKLDRIVTGTYISGNTLFYIDDIKVFVADDNPTNAVGLLTNKRDGVKQYIYPVTKPEAVEGLQDYIVAQGTSDNWTYRKWASGLAECWGTRHHTMDITTASGALYCSTNIGVELFPFTFVDVPKCFGQLQANNGTVWLCPCMSTATVFTPMYQLLAPTQISNLSVTIDHYVVGNWK